MASKLEQAREALKNPNVTLFLDMLEPAEGVGHGYATMFGNTKLDSLVDHPRKLVEFTDSNGKKNKSSAAGRYQFIQGTWDDVAATLKLPDFGPDSQDLGAVELIRRAGALPAVLSGDFDTAVKLLGKTWASLPSSTYPQPKRSMEYIKNFFSQNAPSGTTPSTAGPMASTAGPMASAAGPMAPVAGPMAPVAGPTAPVTGPMATTGPTTPAQQLVQASGATPTVPATEPNAVATLIDALRPTPTLVSDEPAFTPADNAMLAEGLASDVNTQRGQAVAQFFGEDYMPDIPLPDALDESINRYLAML
jgi:muramidase (phage lysozyme)